MVLRNIRFFSSLVMKLKIGNHKPLYHYDCEHTYLILLPNIKNMLPYLKSSSITLCQYDHKSILLIILDRKKQKTSQALI